MSFISKLWKDRVSDYPNKRKLTKEDGTSETVTVERAEGDIVVAGDAFNAENMNDLETRIQNGFNAVEQAQAELNEKITIPLTPVSQVTGYFAQLYKQGNHIFGNGRIAGMTSLPKVESVRSFDNWTGNLVAAATTGLRRIFSTSGNPFKLKNNIYHIIGCGTRSTYNGATGAIVTNSSVVAAMFDGEYTHILLQYDAIPSASGSTQSGVFFIDILI